MPLKNGYSEKTLHENIGEMVKSGHSRKSAIAASLNHARDSYFKAHPSGVLPSYLHIPGRDQRKGAYLKWRGRK